MAASSPLGRIVSEVSSNSKARATDFYLAQRHARRFCGAKQRVGHVGRGSKKGSGRKSEMGWSGGKNELTNGMGNTTLPARRLPF